MQDFLRNVWRYPQFLFLISAGVLSMLLKPVAPLLKNPVQAVALITAVISSSIGLVLILEAMLGRPVQF
jgi:hypothetical protein